jgi:Cupin-like domain
MDTRSVVQQIAKKRRPVVLLNAPIGQWSVRRWYVFARSPPPPPSSFFFLLSSFFFSLLLCTHPRMILHVFHSIINFRNRTPHYLSKRLSKFHGVRKNHKSRSFLYSSTIFNSSTSSLDILDMDVSDFFKEAERLHRDGPGSIYFAHSLSASSLAPLHKDVQPASLFAVPRHSLHAPRYKKLAALLTEDDVPLTSQSSMHLWIARQATTHAHYDDVHNFFVQARGHKHFVVSPTSQYAHLGIHPVLSPHHRQAISKCDEDGFRSPWMNSTTDSSDPNITRSDLPAAYEVLLGPGDVLYIPPFVWHQAEAFAKTEDPSVSVNTWSDSVEGDIHFALTRTVPELLRATSTSHGDNRIRSKMLAVYLRQLVQNVLEFSDPDIKFADDKSIAVREFFANVVHSRFHHIGGTAECEIDVKFCPSDGSLPRPVQIELKGTAEDVASLFGLHSAVHANKGVRDLLLFDILEVTAAHVVGIENCNAARLFTCLSDVHAWA